MGSDDEDAESIHFLGEPQPRPEKKLDFSQPLFLVQFFYSSNVTMYSVNAETMQTAVSSAIGLAEKAGENVITVEAIWVEKLENLSLNSEGGDSNG